MAMVHSNNVQVTIAAPLQATIIKDMDPKLYLAALSGSFEEISCVSNWKEQVTPNGNDVLHIHVGKPPCKTAVGGLAAYGHSRPKTVKVINIDFIKKVLNDNSAAGIGILSGYELLWKENNKGDTPLHLAARFGHADVVKEFLERAKGVNPQEVLRLLRMSNKEKDTPLHEAARAGHVYVVKLLVEADDPNSLHEPNEMNETPLYLAAERGSTASVAIILDTCNVSAVVVQQNRPCGRTPLHAAVQWGDAEMVQKMLEKDGKQIRIQDDKGLTPIHCAAAQLSKSHILKQLLDYNNHNRNNDSSAVCIQDNNGRTALHIALLQDNWKAIEDIIASCPYCVEIADNNRHNVVHYAAKRACVERFRRFVNLGHFDHLLNEKDNLGNTPLHILAMSINSNPGHWCLDRLRGFIRSNSLMDIKAFNRQNLTFADVIASNDRSFNGEWILRKLCKHKTPRGKRIYTFKLDDTDVEKAAKSLDSESDRIGDSTVNSMKKASEARLVVAALIATISFTSALTLPGGFNQTPGKDIGMAVLRNNPAFIAFLISDIIAFMFSIAAILFYFILAGISKQAAFSAWTRYKTAHNSLVISLGALAIALMTGVSAVVSHSVALVSVVCLISVVFFVYYFRLVRNIVTLGVREVFYCDLKKHEIPKQGKK